MRKMVEITTDTRTEYGNFYAGERRSVSAEVAGFLIGNGWAKPAPVTLEVDNAGLGVKSEDIG